MSHSIVSNMTILALSLSAACVSLSVDVDPLGEDAADDVADTTSDSTDGTTTDGGLDTTDTTDDESSPEQAWCCWCGVEGDPACLPWQGEEACAATGAALGVDASETLCTGLPILDNLVCEIACELPADGYCCTCEAGCWLSPSEAECVGFGEWHDASECEFVPPASGECGQSCPTAACCYCDGADATCKETVSGECTGPGVVVNDCVDVDGVVICPFMCSEPPPIVGCCYCDPSFVGESCSLAPLGTVCELGTEELSGCSWVDGALHCGLAC